MIWFKETKRTRGMQLCLTAGKTMGGPLSPKMENELLSGHIMKILRTVLYSKKQKVNLPGGFVVYSINGIVEKGINLRKDGIEILHNGDLIQRFSIPDRSLIEYRSLIDIRKGGRK